MAILGRYPTVSVVVPMRNEEAHIVGCLESLLAQDYPRNRLEILVLDGESTDTSGARVNAIRSEDVRMRLLRNPARSAAAAMNSGMQAAEGEIVIRLDAHACAPAHYVSTVVHRLTTTSAEHVGVRLRAVGRGFWGRSIAVAVTSRFGVGGSAYRCSDASGWDEAGCLGGFWRERLLQLGGFDESLELNEDDEIAFRLERLGLPQFRDATVEIQYFCRDRPDRLARQYFRYGCAKPEVILRHRRARVRHFVPAAAVLLAGALGVTALFARPAGITLALLCAGYLVSSLVFSYRERARLPGGAFLTLPVVYFVLHASYGSGFLIGAARSCVRWLHAR